MRKVFLSASLISKMDLEKPTKYISDDFDLGDKAYNFPMSYLIADNVENGDNIVIITSVAQTENPMENYKLYKQEVFDIVKDKQVDIEFIEIKQETEFTASVLNHFFKEVADIIQDNDTLFMDITFGLRHYTLGMFIAVAYATKAARNVDMDTIIYAQNFKGNRNDGFVSKVFDLTSLFYLNAIASNSRPGQKQNLDKLLGFIIDKD